LPNVDEVPGAFWLDKVCLFFFITLKPRVE